MTWDELLKKAREGLGESGSHLRALGDLMATADAKSGVFNEEQVNIALTLLLLGMSNLHSVVEHMSIGLDAVVEALREANKSQEAKGE